MHRLGYPTPLIDFFSAMLKDQSTSLAIDGFTYEAFKIGNGIGKDDPSTMLLYLIYSYGLKAIPTEMQKMGVQMKTIISSLLMEATLQSVTPRSTQFLIHRKSGPQL